MRHQNKILFLLPCLTLIFFSCTNSVQDQNIFATTKAIIYGKVHLTNSQNTKGKVAVMLVHYPKGCDSVANEREVGGFTESGTYRIIFQVGTPSISSCFTASLVSFTDEVSPTSDYSILSGPQKFKAHLRPNSPYDSVRIDFTYPDSLK